MPTFANCCICQEQTLTRTTLDRTYIGVPPILIKDLLINCFESYENFRNVVSDELRINYLCILCEASLGEFYDAVLKVSLKRTEFLSRILEKSVSPTEYYVVIEPANKDLSSSHETVKHIKNDKIEPFVGEDSCEEYLTLSTSEEEFVKVYQSEEEFEDDWSSNCSIEFEVIEDTEKEPRKASTIIEHIPKSKLRHCWRCDKSFPSDDDFEIHLKQVHTKSKKRSSSSKNSQNSNAFEDQSLLVSTDQKSTWLRCEYCSSEFDSSILFRSHTNEHKERTLPGRISSHGSIKRRRAEKSFQSPEVRIFVCPVCDIGFRTAWNLKRHQKLHCLGDKSKFRKTSL